MRLTKTKLKVFSKSELIQCVLDIQKDLEKCIAANVELKVLYEQGILLRKRRNRDG